MRGEAELRLCLGPQGDRETTTQSLPSWRGGEKEERQRGSRRGDTDTKETRPTGQDRHRPAPVAQPQQKRAGWVRKRKDMVEGEGQGQARGLGLADMCTQEDRALGSCEGRPGGWGRAGDPTAPPFCS